MPNHTAARQSPFARTLTLALCLLCAFISASCGGVYVLREDATLQVTATLAPSGGFGRFIEAVAVSPDRMGNLYVLDRGASTVVKFDSLGDSIRSAGGYGRDHFQFDQPADLDARQTNNIFVADYGNHRIEQYSRELAYLATFYTREDPTQANRFGYPTSIALEDAGNLYLIDGENDRVLKATSDFRIDRVIGGYTTASRPDAVLHKPRSLAVDRANNLTVLDNGGFKLVSFDNLGNPLAARTLRTGAIRIRAFGDTLFVIPEIGNDQNLSIELYNTRTLQPRGIWVVPNIGLPNAKLAGGSELAAIKGRVVDIVVQNGRILLLGHFSIVQYTLTPVQ